MIQQWFAIRVGNMNTKHASMNEIASGIDMKPSNHLLKMLYGMCDKGILQCYKEQRSGRWAGFVFMLKAGTYKEPEHREIPVKVRGVLVHQMELI